jgi:FkbM family methyltransferase
MILESKTVARSIIRKAKLTGVAHRIRMLWHRNEYEDRFADALLGSVRAEDCVWDVGANVGYYTERFSKLARQVVAFEPVLENCLKIEAKKLPNVDCQQVALGDAAGEVPMFVEGQFSSTVAASSPKAIKRTIRVARGDDFATLAQPTVVKIDIEGFEVEVIRGMRRILEGVRALFIEVHFQILDERGMKQAPSVLVQDLKRMGFARVEWPDASHIAAFRV